MRRSRSMPTPSRSTSSARSGSACAGVSCPDRTSRAPGSPGATPRCTSRVSPAWISSTASSGWTRSPPLSSACEATSRRRGPALSPTRARRPEMIDARVQDLLEEVDLEASPEVEAAIVGRDPVAACRFPVGEASAVALAACGVAVSSLWELRGGRPQRARVEVRRAAASLHSRDYLQLDGGPGPASPAAGNPLVDFYRCRDGRWIHLHGALPNLAYGTMRVLGCARERGSVAAAVADGDGEALEEALAEAGMCGALVRTAEAWAAHPQGRALADWPRVSIRKIGESEPEPLPAGSRPLSGVRVLDLTRILAGPSHARTLA